MQRAGSLLWHINCLELWAVHLALRQFRPLLLGRACASLHGQHCACLVHQPAGRYTITPLSPPLESHAVQVTAHCSHPGEAQSCGRHALMTAHIPRRVATPSRDDPADLESIRGSSGGPVCFPPSPPTASCTFPWPRAPSAQTHWHTASVELVEAVALAYQSQGEPCPLGVMAHSTRSVASSHALAHCASLADICRAAGWASTEHLRKILQSPRWASFFPCVG